MKKLVYLLLCLALPASAQQFKVTRDTIHIDAGLFGKTPKMNIHLRAADSREAGGQLVQGRRWFCVL